jgi:hypothetical protein
LAANTRQDIARSPTIRCCSSIFIISNSLGGYGYFALPADLKEARTHRKNLQAMGMVLLFPCGLDLTGEQVGING